MWCRAALRSASALPPHPERNPSCPPRQQRYKNRTARPACPALIHPKAETTQPKSTQPNPPAGSPAAPPYWPPAPQTPPSPPAAAPPACAPAAVCVGGRGAGHTEWQRVSPSHPAAGAPACAAALVRRLRRTTAYWAAPICISTQAKHGPPPQLPSLLRCQPGPTPPRKAQSTRLRLVHCILLCPLVQALYARVQLLLQERGAFKLALSLPCMIACPSNSAVHGGAGPRHPNRTASQRMCQQQPALSPAATASHPPAPAPARRSRPAAAAARA